MGKTYKRIKRIFITIVTILSMLANIFIDFTPIITAQAASTYKLTVSWGEGIEWVATDKDGVNRWTNGSAKSFSENMSAYTYIKLKPGYRLDCLSADAEWADWTTVSNNLVYDTYVDGSLNVFNHRTTIDVNSRLTAYGIRDLGEDLESVGMLITLTNISQRIQQNAAKGIATWLYIDEFHVLLNKKYSRQFFIALWKKVRKQGGICTGITQNVTDVIKDNETKMLVSNSEYTMFLKMGPGDAKVILDTFEGRISPAHLRINAVQ